MGIMSKSKSFNGYVAMLSEMENGRRVSLIESQILFGVQSFNRDLTRMKRDGYLIKSQRVPMAKVIKRLNEFCIVKPPQELPVREILVSEYWIST
tara:strand:+ start:62 stop:346 length:285 start_codon:yes stop_codon:yes gene_type:complete